MRLIPLTQGYFAQVDDSDFEWLTRFKWCASVKKNTVYAITNVKDEQGKRGTLSMHRAILSVKDPLIEVDHADRFGLNNTRENLRISTNSQNQMNKCAQANSTSTYKGVSWKSGRKKWIATMAINGKLKHLGYYKNEQDAARQINHAIRLHHGEFARYNDVFPVFPEKEWMPNVISSKNSSGFRGVSFISKRSRWVANININKKRTLIGTFIDPIEAAKAYDTKARELFGDKARLNFPESRQ